MGDPRPVFLQFVTAKACPASGSASAAAPFDALRRGTDSARGAQARKLPPRGAHAQPVGPRSSLLARVEHEWERGSRQRLQIVTPFPTTCRAFFCAAIVNFTWRRLGGESRRPDGYVQSDVDSGRQCDRRPTRLAPFRCISPRWCARELSVPTTNQGTLRRSRARPASGLVGCDRAVVAPKACTEHCLNQEI